MATRHRDICSCVTSRAADTANTHKISLTKKRKWKKRRKTRNDNPIKWRNSAHLFLHRQNVEKKKKKNAWKDEVLHKGNIFFKSRNSVAETSHVCDRSDASCWCHSDHLRTHSLRLYLINYVKRWNEYEAHFSWASEKQRTLVKKGKTMLSYIVSRALFLDVCLVLRTFIQMKANRWYWHEILAIGAHFV